MSRLHRRAVVRELLEDRGELLVVAGLGAPAWDITAAGDHPLSFPMWGAMGGAAMIGLGLALAQPKRKVLVVTGDGEMLMGLGSLATVGAQQPPNLTIVVLDNGLYGETGMQRSHTSLGTRLADVARGCGIGHAVEVRALEEAEVLARRAADRAGPAFAQVHVRGDELPRVLPPRDGAFLKNRLRRTLGLGPL